MIPGRRGYGSSTNDDVDPFAFGCLAVIGVIVFCGWLAECAGRPYTPIPMVVIDKHFSGGRDSCFGLTVRKPVHADDDAGDRICVQPDEFNRTKIGDTVIVNVRYGRISGHVYPEDFSYAEQPSR